MSFFASENVYTQNYKAFSTDIRWSSVACDFASHCAVALPLQKETTDSCQLLWYVASNSSILYYCHAVLIEGVLFLYLAAEFFVDGRAPASLVVVMSTQGTLNAEGPCHCCFLSAL